MTLSQTRSRKSLEASPPLSAQLNVIVLMEISQNSKADTTISIRCNDRKSEESVDSTTSRSRELVSDNKNNTETPATNFEENNMIVVTAKDVNNNDFKNDTDRSCGNSSSGVSSGSASSTNENKKPYHEKVKRKFCKKCKGESLGCEKVNMITRSKDIGDRIQKLLQKHNANPCEFNNNSNKIKMPIKKPARLNINLQIVENNKKEDEKHEVSKKSDNKYSHEIINSKYLDSNNCDENTSKYLSAEDSLTKYRAYLSTYERKEISDWSKIYYLGLEATKIQGTNAELINFRFDDARGNYNKVLYDHIAYRYEVLEEIGKGSFGQVFRAYDHKTCKQVAIKIIRNKKQFHQQATIETKILKSLNKNDQDDVIVKMLSNFIFRSHYCIVFELLSLNLYEVMKKNGYKGFNTNVIRRFSKSILNCLVRLTKENVIHCDLKPENILLKRLGGSFVKVIDFGSACYSDEKIYSYIQSRFYRAPEVILGLPYDLSIDMWSFGCVVAELYIGHAIFPGESEEEQLACIMEVLGKPPPNLINRSKRRERFFDAQMESLFEKNGRGKKRLPGSKTLLKLLNRCPDLLFVNFISRCLEWEPKKRMTPEEAIQHPWMEANSNSQRHKENLNKLCHSSSESSLTKMKAGLYRNFFLNI